MNRYDQQMQDLKGEFFGASDGYVPIHVTDEDFSQVEKILGEPLPSDYREFVRDYGMYTISATFPLKRNWEPVPPGSVQFFKGILSGQDEVFQRNYDWLDLLHIYDHLKAMVEGWPEEWIVIADGDGSDCYALAFKGVDKGKVFYIAEWSMTRRIQIADSFDAFLMQIQRLDTDDIDC